MAAQSRTPILPGTRYQVVEGDTLSSIAARVSGRKVNLWTLAGQIFAANPAAFIRNDTATPVALRAVEFNRAAYEQLGYTAEEFAQLSVGDYEAAESPEETRRRLETILERGHDSFETVHRTKDGTQIDVWVNVVLLELGGTPHVMAVYRDITERRRKDQEIDRVQTLAHIGTLEWDILKDEFCGSEESSRIFGLSFSEKPSIRAVLDRVIAEERPRVEAELAQAMQEGVYDAMCRIDHGDGDIRWVKTSAEFCNCCGPIRAGLTLFIARPLYLKSRLILSGCGK